MSNSQKAASVLVGKGRQQEAIYSNQILENYKGNPLIEALPPIWSIDEVAESLVYYPEYRDEHREMPSHIRLHLIRSTLQLFIPLPIHFDLEQRFSSMIRLGYQARNPSLTGFWKDARTKADALNIHQKPPRSTASGFTIIGISGIGKTTSVEAILNLYPQVLFHSYYNGAPFGFVQIVWLKLDCPFDGSIKGLCLNFFQAVDDILDTSYYKNYARGRKTVDELLPLMALVASNHGIGVLVIDEIQHLSHAKSGGSRKMLNFFVQLINTIGLPVVLVGTFKALPILNGEFRQTRRGSGQGDLVWDRMKNDESWQYFVESLWSYQYTQKLCRLTETICNTLYDVTQGITDFAVKVYMLAQIRAISNFEEVITEDSIYQTAKKSLRMAMPILEALKKQDTAILASVEDVIPLDIDKHLHDSQRDTNRSEQFRALTRVRTNTTSNSSSSPSETTTPVKPKTAPIEPDKQRSAKRQRNNSEKVGLVEIVKAGNTQKIRAYDALSQAGFIRPAAEYIEDWMPS
jgi:hypothetical protein